MSLHDAKNKKNSMHWFSLKLGSLLAKTLIARSPPPKKKTFLYYSTHKFFMKPEKSHFGPIWPKNSRISFKNPALPCKKNPKQNKKRKKEKNETKDKLKNRQACKQGVVFHRTRNSHCQMFFKIGALKNFAAFTGKHRFWSVSWMKLLAWRSVNILKRDSNTGVFLWILRNFYGHLFWRTSANGCFCLIRNYLTLIYNMIYQFSLRNLVM